MGRAKASIAMILAALSGATMILAIPKESDLRIPTTMIERGDLVESTYLTGTVSYRERQPCISFLSGKIEQVYVQAGSEVKKGQLLVRIDTSSEEAMLSRLENARYINEANVSSYAEVGAIIGAQNLELLQTIQQLQSRIDGAQIRAAVDGVIEAIYVSDGDYVSEGAVVGLVRSEDKCLLALQKAEKTAYQPGTEAYVFENQRPIGLVHLSGVDQSLEQSAQQLTFVPKQEDLLGQIDAGMLMTMEVIDGCVENVALVPFAAISREREIWIIENGRAHATWIDTSLCNDKYVALPEEWAGKQVVLAPDRYDLSEGCLVKEDAAR